MIERNKKLIIILSILLVASQFICVPFIFIFDRSDILGVSAIISALLLLLWINVRSGMNLKKRYKEEYYKKKKIKNDDKYKEESIVYYVFLALFVIVAIIECICVF